jgi:hypothetical protein
MRRAIGLPLAIDRDHRVASATPSTTPMCTTGIRRGIEVSR